MKALLVCTLLVGSLFFEPKNRNIVAPVKAHSSNDTIPTDTISFTTQILPILVNHCTPCHFTGGKMHDRLPFDKDTTIVGHEEGVLQRIKDEKENALIKQFIQQQKK
jgi:hypothetical protein